MVSAIGDAVGVGPEPTAAGLSAGTQDVRFATAMTGGVSLAIWMGGVARELNLLEQASRQRESLAAGAVLPSADAAGFADDVSRALYVRLLEVLDCTVSTDILSGTSAGGINAALLGFTRSCGLDLSILRKVWLETGSFDLLLRDPGEKSPPSLLQGDHVLLKGLNAGIAELAGKPANPLGAQGAAASDPHTTVFITTTLLAGETSRFTDDFGTLVQDVEHRGLFRFDETDLVIPANRAALALAARSSAAFPAAFEPAFLPCGHDADDQHPDMAPFSNITRDHFAADGGLLMNRPIKPLIEEVFTRQAGRQVRRVLLYVVPSPGDAPDPTKTPPAAKQQEPLTFAGALAKDVSALLGQSISAELRVIRQHNQTVGGMADTRRRVAELGALLPPGQPMLQTAALTDYRLRESSALARPTVTALMRAITTMPAEKMPRQWAEALEPGGCGEDDCASAIAGVIAEPWPVTVPALGDTAAIASFGRGPFDGAKATVLVMLQAAWLLARGETDREDLRAASVAVHGALGTTTETNLARVVAGRLHDVTAATTTDLAPFAAEVEAAVDAARRIEGGLAVAWTTLADAVATIAPLLQRLRDSTVAANALAADRRVAQRDLDTYLLYLGLSGAPGSPPPADTATVASRLFELHVVTRSTLATAPVAEQHVDLVQVSADTRSGLSDHAFATDKLTGLQFHHFGAFYKSSWRANDWMWGRLDGAGWLVHVLLDPRRVQVLAEEFANGNRATWFLDRVKSWFPMLPDPDPAVVTELAYLDDPTVTRPPEHLAQVSMWIARAFQRRIVAEELPVVASEVLLDPTTDDGNWALEVLQIANTPAAAVAATRGATAALVDGRWTKEQQKARAKVQEQLATASIGPDAQTLLVEKLKDCPVPSQTLADEAGQPLFTRTVTKAVAVGTAATAEAKEMPAVLRPTLAAVRRITLLAYRLAAVTRGNRRMIAVTGLLLTIAGVLLSVWGQGVFGVTGAVAVAVGVYVLVLVTSRNLAALVTWIGGLAAAAAIAFGIVLWSNDDFRTWLFETPKRQQHQGWVSREVLPWLLDPAWRAPAVWFGLVAVVTGLGLTIVVLAEKLHHARKRS